MLHLAEVEVSGDFAARPENMLVFPQPSSYLLPRERHSMKTVSMYWPPPITELMSRRRC